MILEAYYHWRPNMFEVIPWRRPREVRPFDEMDRFLDRIFERRPFRFFDEDGGWVPSANLSETEKEVHVEAEIPGMDPKDISVSLDDGVLSIRGERKHEHEEKEENYHRIERSYGSFSRSFRLPAEVDADKVEADYKNGVLKIRMPKTKESSVKKIEVKAA
jgi:HSP20 family protein